MESNEIKVVLFKINNNLYCFHILDVQEIIRIPDKITNILSNDNNVKGIINLRDKVLPIIDLREKLNIKEIIRTNENRIIVCSYNNTIIGFIVDEVEEVLSVYDSQLESLDNILANDITKKIIKIDDKIIQFLDINAILKNEDLRQWDHD